METRTLGIIASHGLSPSQIKIEVTERTLVSNAELVESKLIRLHKSGLNFGLDDFGVGFSNVETILKLPMQTVKLDKGLIYTAIGHENRTSFLRSITSAFLGLGCTVVAEGVETARQAAYVEGCGCTAIQGYYYARPMAEEACTAFLLVHRERRCANA